MGIFKIDFKTFKKINLYYKKLNNKEIDMTNFLNLCIRKKIITIKIKKYSDQWFEIDTHQDIKLATKLLK